ncbi:uncharacterized protein PGTG_22164 [Puccinia graminis f. sp. tritici CRL 75-36-700-3]|uniref:Uncharacterized protein n=1 Tax=Puccinia graminis f. sp. tritici (strain CRL 75-36-700-3 / race SCCL) TaxID=418459 RepID=H6QTN2_PUCGT|nr:uncharacterized protein PGTG_22164 [Puccinia graminis f. sp. tritici CRL 75-36-700-3]EHS64247.1 hypothetical protein PGTG_22164 [Puccinia graminis f. sp. tritici CRL 75-36-700-3]
MGIESRSLPNSTGICAHDYILEDCSAILQFLNLEFVIGVKIDCALMQSEVSKEAGSKSFLMTLRSKLASMGYGPWDLAIRKNASSLPSTTRSSSFQSDLIHALKKRQRHRELQAPGNPVGVKQNAH